eukprot:gene15687-21794_t
MAAHPFGLLAHRGFFGCRHFSQSNDILHKKGLGAIDWQIDPMQTGRWVTPHSALSTHTTSCLHFSQSNDILHNKGLGAIDLQIDPM